MGYKILWLNLTSQAWLTPADVSQSIWWHYVAVIVPQNLNSSFASKGLLYITGGNNGPTPPKITSEDLIVAAVLAQSTQTVATVLFQIPNQPIHFWAQGPNAGGKTEDALIALSWRLFLDNPNRTEFIPYVLPTAQRSGSPRQDPFLLLLRRLTRSSAFLLFLFFGSATAVTSQ